jgi:hypothetical protein
MIYGMTLVTDNRQTQTESAGIASAKTDITGIFSITDSIHRQTHDRHRQTQTQTQM